ncbi:hypothetical protein Q5P01_011181 [Channa striata]|uniref:Uncharacterized protein n=1 Tax=Channa striata TaxID=64152 RepID=A0AA88MX37_CHASR|nr:hypothetical protein Q5P01_011181 [Channa striata]
MSAAPQRETGSGATTRSPLEQLPKEFVPRTPNTKNFPGEPTITTLSGNNCFFEVRAQDDCLQNEQMVCYQMWM